MEDERAVADELHVAGEVATGRLQSQVTQRISPGGVASPHISKPLIQALKGPAVTPAVPSPPPAMVSDVRCALVAGMEFEADTPR